MGTTGKSCSAACDICQQSEISDREQKMPELWWQTKKSQFNFMNASLPDQSEMQYSAIASIEVRWPTIPHLSERRGFRPLGSKIHEIPHSVPFYGSIRQSNYSIQK
jgi:hypothetical protein